MSPSGAVALAVVFSGRGLTAASRVAFLSSEDVPRGALRGAGLRAGREQVLLQLQSLLRSLL